MFIKLCVGQVGVCSKGVCEGIFGNGYAIPNGLHVLHWSDTYDTCDVGLPVCS